MARQVKKYITSMSLLETCAVANLAWKEALLDKECGTHLLETLQDHVYADIVKRVPKVAEEFPTRGMFFEELDEFCASHNWFVTDDFFSWLGIRRSEGPPFYRARYIFKEYCTSASIPIRGYL